MVIMAGSGTAGDEEAGQAGQPRRAHIPTALTQLNIAAARKHFEKFIPENS